MVVDERGRPEILRVERRLGYGLDEEAIIAASQWRFEPALKDGNAVAARIAVDISFSL
jgi:protein TonB